MSLWKLHGKIINSFFLNLSGQLIFPHKIFADRIFLFSEKNPIAKKSFKW
jgi:hypothetical protein